jgi:hypothetical protein
MPSSTVILMKSRRNTAAPECDLLDLAIFDGQARPLEERPAF